MTTTIIRMMQKARKMSRAHCQTLSESSFFFFKTLASASSGKSLVYSGDSSGEELSSVELSQLFLSAAFESYSVMLKKQAPSAPALSVSVEARPL